LAFTNESGCNVVDKAAGCSRLSKATCIRVVSKDVTPATCKGMGDPMKMDVMWLAKYLDAGRLAKPTCIRVAATWNLRVPQ
jgi:hypothetical protein